MQFVQCPHCGMKILQSAKTCKGCQKAVGDAPVVELKPFSPDEGRQAGKQAAVLSGGGNAGQPSSKKPSEKTAVEKAGPAEAEKRQPEPEARASDAGVTFDDLIESGLSGGDDGQALDQIEVVRDAEDEKPPDPGIRTSKGAGGLAHISIIEKEDPKGMEAGSNFRRNVLPRLLQIFALLLLLAIIGVCVFIYNIMDLPQYYNTFHMRSENSKSFNEAAVQLNVCENARLDPKLGFQVSEIENSFKNSYVMWKVIVSQVTPITSDPLSKHTYVLMVKGDRLSKSSHFIRMYMNDKMIARIRKKPFFLKEERSMTVNGRIIGWARSSDRKSLEIELYDAEVVEGY